MKPTDSGPETKGLKAKLASDALCDRFEKAWQGGARPDLTSFLPADATLRLAALPELVLLDMEYRSRAGEAASAEKYLARYPELRTQIDAVQRLHAAENRLAQQAQRPTDPTHLNASKRSNAETVTTAGGEASVDLTKVLAPPQAEDELGRLGQYRVLKVLGQGGMGMVLLAEDAHLLRPAALKIMLPKFAQDAEARQRFLREARAAAQLKHDHIVTIFQVGEEHGVPFIALEYLQGSPLDRHLKEKGELPLGEVIRIGRQIAEGLHAAHEHGLIHRDIKPANIWLEDRSAGRGTKGGKGSPLPQRVKILDFGLARPERDDNAQLTQSGAIVGTPAFMSPEQARCEPVDLRSDLFSLGIVLYRLCTGRLPFGGASTFAVLTSVVADTPAAVRQLNPAVPVELEQLINRLLAKDRDARPGSALEVAEALDALGQSTLGRSPARAAATMAMPTTTMDYQSSGGVAAKPHRRRTLAVGTFMAFVVILLALGALYLTHTKGKDGTPGPVAVDVKDNAEVGPPAAKEDPDRRAVEMLRPYIKVVRPGQNTGICLALDDGRRLWVSGEKAIPDRAFSIVKINFAVEEPGPFPADFSDNLVSAIVPLASLEEFAPLAVRPWRFSDEDMERLAGAPFAAKLSRLEAGFELTPRTMDALRRFPKLRRLACLIAKADDDLISRLRELSNLKELSLRGNPNSNGQNLTQRGMKAIAALPLRRLVFRGMRLSAENVRTFATMPELAIFELEYQPGGDELLPEIAKFPALERLNLYQSKHITDKGIMQLTGMKTVRLINLGATGVTRAGAKQLSDAMPKCRVKIKGAVFGPIDKSSPPLSDDDPDGYPDESADPDRTAVEMLSPHLPALVVRMSGSGKEVTLTKKDAIPDRPFVLTGIKLRQGMPQLPSDFTSRVFLPAVLPLGSLESIYPYNPPLHMTDGELAALASAPFAEQVTELGGTFELSQKTIDSLKRFSKLKILHCKASLAGDSDLARLKELSSLRQLRLEHLGKSSRVSAAGIKAITDLPLTALRLHPATPPLDAKTIALVAAIPHLRDLQLSGPNITDDRLRDFAKCPGLVTLGLLGTPLTDDGLLHLTRIKSLRWVQLGGSTKVTEAGAKRLSDALPKCQILLPGRKRIGPKDKSVPPLLPDDDPDGG
jgi:serine/threonine protein kinase